MSFKISRRAPLLVALALLGPGGCESARLDAANVTTHAADLCDDVLVRVDEAEAAEGGARATPCHEQCTPGEFVYNDFWTTGFGTAAADVVTGPSNFLACEGNPFAMCFYSGSAVDPPVANGSSLDCIVTPAQAPASNYTCRCAIFEEGHNYVSINSILNTEAYIETVRACLPDGSGCRNLANWDPIRGCKDPDDGACERIAPVCSYLWDSTQHRQALYPQYDAPGGLISTFSFDRVADFHVVKDGKDCTSEADEGYYGGCMTAYCTPKVDASGNTYASCECPTFYGPFQLGRANVGCSDAPWSASYTVPSPTAVASEPQESR